MDVQIRTKRTYLIITAITIPPNLSELTNNSNNTLDIRLDIPFEIQKNCIGFVIGSSEEISLASDIGASWIRPHPGPFAWQWIESEKNNFDFSLSDEYVINAQEKNMAILGTIWPYADLDQAKCHSSECYISDKDIFYPKIKMNIYNGPPKSRCIPCNFSDYGSFITKLVERYDGDSINGMPGLKIPIKNWEILNEPEMKSDEMTFFKGTSDEHAIILKATYNTIKEECADCNVLHAGIAGTMPFMLEYWKEIFIKSKDFDINNIHFIRNTDILSLNVKDFKNFLEQQNINKAIWVTEAEFNSENDIKSGLLGALNAGASKVFFTQFKVGQFGLPENGGYSLAYQNLFMECK